MAMTQLAGFLPPARPPAPAPPDLGEAASALLQSLGVPGALPGALPDAVTTAINNLRTALRNTETDAEKAALRGALSALERALTAASLGLNSDITMSMETVKLALGDPSGNFAALDNLTIAQRAALRHAFITLSSQTPYLRGGDQLTSVVTDRSADFHSISATVTSAGVYEITIWNEGNATDQGNDPAGQYDPEAVNDVLLWQITSGPDNSVDLNDLHDGFSGKKLTREIGEAEAATKAPLNK